MNVARQYPARTDANGRTWFRPVRSPGMDFAQWGWTSQPCYAHPDYLHRTGECGDVCGLCEFHPQGTCEGDCAGCVAPGEGA
ncbi:hypothetical protein I5G80_gp060 [Mycobacterium phage Krueger]|uniref:Uncharacterized protein n=1 Tax=Mycobacterium phage Krueger TaxID=2015820 RepID=A0A222ZLE9_9CAUD|nr:hypothetical protein I5G80_gp060 [Mycobacterium phage Krueger]ASR85584.1 hypothetical protein SEA_KRUEGER_86 [Mycobacterium phage Krueger]UTN93277.1 hypothetical protein SEA_SUNFLOWER1121_85 [Mycobacterium Phage Sunflower1121]WNM67564.1 hypothetical protein SEA_SHADOW1_86 [Mycobacterium phage Shadow1]